MPLQCDCTVRRIHLACLSLVAVAGLACSTVAVSSDFDPSYDFSGLKTYTWMSTQPEQTGDPRVDNQLTEERIRRAVDEELAAKGYVKREQPVDFLVAYSAAIERRTDVEVVQDYYGPGWGYWGAGSSYTTISDYDEGSILLDILDPANKKLIWRGVAAAELYFDSTPEERDQRTREAVEKILERFPPENK